MKTGMKVVVCAVIGGGLIGGGTFAQRGVGHPRQQGPEAVQAMLTRTLELNETQQENIRAIFEENTERLAEARAVGGEARMELGSLVLQGADEQTLREAWRRYAVELEEVLVSVAEVVAEVKRELTPEQVEKVKNLREFVMEMHASKLDMIP